MTETSGTGRKSASDALNLNFSGLMNTSGNAGNTVSQESAKVGIPAADIPQHRATPENIRMYKSIFRDAYNFLEKHLPHGQESDGGYWDNVIIDFSDLSAKYAEQEQATEFASEIIGAAFTELEREYKRLNG